jgi:hypothetical protein
MASGNPAQPLPTTTGLEIAELDRRHYIPEPTEA